jgi:hypothetical protein
MPPRKDREHQEQKALIQMCDAEAVRDSRYGEIFSIPNGGMRHIGVAVKLKAEGQRPGIPDLFLPIPSRKYHGLFIEMKVKPNKPTDEQTERILKLREYGYAAGVCYSAFQAFDIIRKYLGERPKSSQLQSQ